MSEISPAAKHKLIIRHTGEERFEISFNGRHFGIFCYDIHGSEGMRAVQQVARGLAQELGLEVVEEDAYEEEDERIEG